MNFFQEGEIVLAPNKFSKKDEKGEILMIRKGIYAYVRFFNRNKRMDEWVPLSNLSHAKTSSLAFKKRVEFKKNSGNQARNIDSIRVGDYEICCWYYSPYPSNFCNLRHLYICEHCFKYFTTTDTFEYHFHSKVDRRPPGQEIYRHGSVSIFEVTSENDRVCCQCIYLLCKLFLEESSLSYSVDNVSFLILCECDNDGAHPIGFLSRPLDWDSNIVFYEIVVLPPFQRNGYSQILLECVYEMAHRSCVVGGIGRCLNDLGEIAFNKFLSSKIADLMRSKSDEVKTVKDVSLFTSICRNDVLMTLRKLGLVEGFSWENVEEIPDDKIEEFLRNSKINNRRKVFYKEFLMWFTQEVEEVIPKTDD